MPSLPPTAFLVTALPRVLSLASAAAAATTTSLLLFSFLLTRSPTPTPTSPPSATTTTTASSPSPSPSPLPQPPLPPPPLPFCPPNTTHLPPCHDPSRERHCPPRPPPPPPHPPPPHCRVPPPEGYRPPPPWPARRARARFANAPFVAAKADQNWVRVQGEWLVFPGGGTSFVKGVGRYVERMELVVPLRGGEVRTALDIGCGVASFGDYLLNYDILTMSIAPRDIHEAQVQFALERGLPAMLGVLGVHRLPYPSRSFDMAHCARCLVPWTAHDGLYMLEIDRVLRPGGYWVLSGPPIGWKSLYKGWKRTREDLQAEQLAIEDLAKKLCWRKVAEKGTIAVWRKPTNHIDCAKKAKFLNSPSFCTGDDPDNAWYENIELCISRLPRVEFADDVAGGAVEKWPERLAAVPPRINSGEIEGITVETYNHDSLLWSKRVAYYGTYFKDLSHGNYRNVMDMSAGFGGFAAAMSKYQVWVMNVVPANGTNNTLGIIYERGLIGTYMDWCEAFSTYPRTYDLIHASGVFSLYTGKCGLLDILLEMDRILRPGGAALVRDKADVIVKVKEAADRLRWHSKIVDSENGALDPETVLIVDNSLTVS